MMETLVLRKKMPVLFIRNNYCWLNAVKETKVVFFVRDNSGEKFLTAHAAGRNFSEVFCRACAVAVHSWFSHLHGKFCVLALTTSPARPALFEPRIWLVGTVGSQRPVLILVFPGCMCRFFPSAGRCPDNFDTILYNITLWWLTTIWCFGVAAIKNHTPLDSCVVWCCTKIFFFLGGVIPYVYITFYNHPKSQAVFLVQKAMTNLDEKKHPNNAENEPHAPADHGQNEDASVLSVHF